MKDHNTDCDEEDVEDLTDYYNRIMNRQDPISLLYKNQLSNPSQRVRQPDYYPAKRKHRFHIGLILGGVAIILICAAIWTFYR